MTARNGFGLRAAAAVLVLVGGAVHLQQWLTVFRDQSIGPTFVLNAAASLLVAIALVATDEPVIVRRSSIAGVALSVGSLAALVASRTVGLPGFEATGYDTAEIEAIVVEVLAAAVLVVALVLGRHPVRATEPVLPGPSQPPLGVG
jgi:hypothetical protein